MLTDEELVHEIRTRLRAELAALEPSSDLLRHVREQAVQARSPAIRSVRARAGAGIRANLTTVVSILISVGVLGIHDRPGPPGQPA